MSASLLESLGGLVSPNALQAAAKITGEPTGALGKAFGAAFPTILGGLLSNSTNSGLMGQIASILTQGAGNTGWLGNVAGSLAAGMVPSSAMSLGSTLLGLLFGKRLDAITAGLGSLSGLKPGAASSVLGLAAPMIIGVIADRLKSAGGISPANLHSFLSQQSAAITAAVPSQIASLLSAPAVPAAAAGAAGAAAAAVAGAVRPAAPSAPAAARPAVAGAPAAPAARMQQTAAGAVPASAAAPQARRAPAPVAATHAHTAEQQGGSRIAFLAAWWILLGLLTALIWWWWSSHIVATVAPAAAPSATVAPKAEAPAAKPAPAPEKQAAAPAPAAAPAISFTPSAMEGRLIDFIKDGSKPVDKTTWFDFPNITFKTASAEIADEAAGQIKNIAAIMKAFPAVALKIGGYTDNTGDPDRNVTLSGNRAKAVMQALTEMGIAANRLEAEGYGPQFPVASNDTEEGRAMNRRISLRVTQK